MGMGACGTEVLVGACGMGVLRECWVEASLLEVEVYLVRFIACSCESLTIATFVAAPNRIVRLQMVRAFDLC